MRIIHGITIGREPKESSNGCNEPLRWQAQEAQEVRQVLEEGQGTGQGEQGRTRDPSVPPGSVEIHSPGPWKRQTLEKRKQEKQEKSRYDVYQSVASHNGSFDSSDLNSRTTTK